MHDIGSDNEDSLSQTTITQKRLREDEDEGEAQSTVPPALRDEERAPLPFEDGLDWLNNQNYEQRGVICARCDKTPGEPISFSNISRSRTKTLCTQPSIGPLAVALEVAEHFQWTSIIQFIHQERRSDRILNYYKYLIFKTPVELYNVMSTPTEKYHKVKSINDHKVAYEVLQEGCYLKPYLDVEARIGKGEMKGLEIEDEVVLFENACLSAAQEALKDFDVPHQFTTNIVVKTNSRPSQCGGYKFSCHVVVNDVYTENNTDGLLKSFAMKADIHMREIWHLAEHVEAGKTIVDLVVYNKNRLMRLLHAHKHQKKCIASIMESTPMSLAPCSFNFNNNSESAFMDSLIVIGRFRPVHPSKFFLDTAKEEFDECDYESQKETTSQRPPSRIQSTAMPSFQARHLSSIASNFFRKRSMMFALDANDEFDPGRITRKGCMVFFEAPSDKFCEVKGRCHRDDTSGTQTYYCFDWGRGTIFQACYSCPIKGTVHKVETHRFSLEEALQSNIAHSIVYYMAQELDAQKVNVVPSKNPQQSGVFIWDECESGGGAFNKPCTGTKLWIQGGTDTLATMIVWPWMETALEMIFDDSSEQCDEIKLYKKVMSPNNIASISKLLRSILCNRKINGQNFETLLNNSQKYLLPTNDLMCVDLRTGQKVAREPHFYFSIEASFSMIDSKHNEERIKKVDDFVLTIAADEDKKIFLQKIFGYSMAATQDDRRSFFHIGIGRNGKSTIDQFLAAALGDFHRNVRSNFITQPPQSSSADAAPDIHCLKHVRFINVPETDNQKVHATRLKGIASGDRISARGLYKDEENMVLPGTVHVTSNFLGKFDAEDTAMRDRMCIIRYNMRFVTDEPDPNNKFEAKANLELVKSIQDDTDAFGTWLVLGAIAALQDISKHGSIIVPACVKDDTKDEIDKINVIHQFFQTCCVVRSKKATSDKTREAWSWEQSAMFNTFRAYTASIGHTELKMWDEGRFNAAILRYTTNNRLPVDTFKYGDAYSWSGIRPSDASASFAKSDIRSFGQFD